ETTWGRVSGKVASLGGDRKVIPEYEECKTIAQIHDLPLYEVIYQVRCEALRQLLDQEGKRKEET
ncbi:MAG: nickel insertion protein, partial [Atribacterota bacterium]